MNSKAIHTYICTYMCVYVYVCMHAYIISDKSIGFHHYSIKMTYSPNTFLLKNVSTNMMICFPYVKS